MSFYFTEDINEYSEKCELKEESGAAFTAADWEFIRSR